MPYIRQALRKLIVVPLTLLIDALCSMNAGDGVVNYVIFSILKRVYVTSGVSYGRLNAAIGVLECCKAEFYRRYVVPYEDSKIADPNHGDI